MGSSNRKKSFFFVVSFLVLFLFNTVKAAVLGIDYGAEFLKISIVAPGRTPITLVINEISKRKTTVAVSFINQDRWLGEEAMNYQARYPEKVTTRLRELLGKSAKSDLVLDYKEKYKLPFEIRENDQGNGRETVEVFIDVENVFIIVANMEITMFMIFGLRFWASLGSHSSVSLNSLDLGKSRSDPAKISFDRKYFDDLSK